MTDFERDRIAEARAKDERLQLLKKRVGLAILFGLPLWFCVRWVGPRIAPDLLLASRGDFSRKHAEPFREMVRFGQGDPALRYFEEVPGALDLYRDYVRRYPEAANVPILDPEVRRLGLSRWLDEFDRPGYSGLELTLDGFEPRDYDLVARTSDEMTRSGPNVEAMLGLDFERARKEILASPPNRAALVTLVRWGVPRAEVEQAVQRLDRSDEWSDDEFRRANVTPPDEALAIRLILEDQTLTDPMAEIGRAGLPKPRLDPPLDRPMDHPPSSVRRTVARAFPSGRYVLKGEWLLYAERCLARDPRDGRARDYLRRALDTPISGYRRSSRAALVEFGDPEAIARVRAGLASSNAGTVIAALEACRGDAAVPLLIELKDHRWPWVRIRAVDRLRAIATPVSLRALRDYARNDCRDARLLATSGAPFAIGAGATRDLLARPWTSRDGTIVHPDIDDLR